MKYLPYIGVALSVVVFAGFLSVRYFSLTNNSEDVVFTPPVKVVASTSNSSVNVIQPSSEKKSIVTIPSVTQTLPALPQVNPDSQEPPLAEFWYAASAGTPLASYRWGISGDDDYYDGGSGTDTLEYSGARSEYEVVRSPLNTEGSNFLFLVRKKSDNSLDIVVNIEVIVFKDQTVLVENLF